MKIIAKPTLREARKAPKEGRPRGEALIDIAYVARVSENQMSRIERGTRPVSNAIADRLLKHFGKKFDDLFRIED